MESESTHLLNAVELQKCASAASSTTPASSTSPAVVTATPVQVVKPTLRQNQDSSSSGNSATAKHSENYPGMGVASIKREPEASVSSVPAEFHHGEPTEIEGDQEFEWNDYLDATGATAAPPTAFSHVEYSLQTLFTKDMKLEVPNRLGDGTYWVASVVMTCGPLLRLRYEGYGEDRSADFWCEIALGELRPVGWCAANNRTLHPPPAIKSKYPNWEDYLMLALEGATYVPAYLLDASGCTAVDQIKQRMSLEVQDQAMSTNVWIATVIENVGGRLLLRYSGIEDSSLDFWLFYLSYRLHPVGWAKLNGCQYSPPLACTAKHTTEEWADIIRGSLSQSGKMQVPDIIFKNQEKVVQHYLKEGMKLEAIHPTTLFQICPATISRVLNCYFFVVEIDGGNEISPDVTPVSFCCHSNSLLIFPVGWAKSNRLPVTFPKGWQQDGLEFNWEDYLRHCAKESGVQQIEVVEKSSLRRVTIDHGLEQGMKLESVNPFQQHQICAATITKVVDSLIWLQLDNSISGLPSHITPANSYDMFPVGWCESNRFPLKIPLTNHQEVANLSAKKVAIVMPKKQKLKDDDLGSEEACELVKNARENQATGKAWCPEIYANHKCFSGPFLSKARIAGLPKHVGPGPVTLVLKEIISMIVGVSYLPSRTLSVLQLRGEPGKGMLQQLIKAKYKGRTFSAMVEIVRNSDRVADFCQKICRKLQCCPNLFGPLFFGESCPEKCYTLRKTNKIVSLKKGKKRRKNKMHLHHLKPQSMETVDAMDQSNGGEEASTESPKAKRKYIHKIVPKSDIVTRGAQIPNFALEMRRRRRKSASRSYLSILNKSILQKQQSPIKSVAPIIRRGLIGRPRKIQLQMPPAVRVLQLDEPLAYPAQNSSYGTSSSTPSTSSTMANRAFLMDTVSSQMLHSKEFLHLGSNPIKWSIEEVFSFINRTDCAPMARVLKEQEIDGQALLLLTLPTLQEHLELKLGPAIKLCHHIERIKLAFYSQYDS